MSYSDVPLLAHRGDMTRYPENTILALRSVIEVGIKLVEFDIQLSKDEVPVLLHDANLKRITGRDLSVFDLSAVELQDVEVQMPQGGDSPHPFDCRIPTLREVVYLLNKTPQVRAFVEIKGESIERYGLEETVERILDELSSALFPYTIISKESECLLYARGLSDCHGNSEVGWVVPEYTDEIKQRASKMLPHNLLCNIKKLPQDDSPLWAGPWKWVVYDITSREEATKLHARGVSIVESGDCLGMMAA